MLGDGVLKRIASSCPNLSNLNVRACYSTVTDSNLLFMIKRLPMLRNLNISYCKYVSDKAIEAISQTCKELLYLDISDNPLLTDSSLQHLRKSPKLYSLDITGCSKITADGYNNFVRDVPHVRVVSDFLGAIYFRHTEGVRYSVFSTHQAGYPISMQSKQWPTVQHYFQAQKFPNDSVLTEELRKCETPLAALKMGTETSVPIRPDWNEVRYTIHKEANFAKFIQHADAGAILLETGDRPLIYNAKDPFWGNGDGGTGENFLGKLLMEIREELRQINSN